ncbi:hypothetical protein BGZ98_002907, partial [Dissophora globulifera]
MRKTKNPPEGHSTQAIDHSTALHPTTLPRTLQKNDYQALHLIDQDTDDEKHSASSSSRMHSRLPATASVKYSRPEDPSNTVHRQFFFIENVTLSRAKNALFSGKSEGPHFKPPPEKIARIPPETSTFRLVGKFNNYRSGHYAVRWRVKALEDFYIPNGLHFVVNVVYDAEPDVSGSLDVIMPPHKLSLLAPDRWYNLVLEEKLIIHPHEGTARIEVILCNNENVDRVEYSGFEIEHVEIRPMSMGVDPQVGIPDFVVPKAAMPNFTINASKVPSPIGSSSYIPPSTDVPVTRLAASKSSRFLASLALSEDAAYINVWDMSVIRNPSNPGSSMPRLYNSCAVAIVPHIGIGELTIGLSISASGDQLVIFQEPKIGEWAEGKRIEKATFQFKLFNNPLVRQSSVVLDMETSGDNNVNNSVDEKGEVKKAAVDNASPPSGGRRPRGGRNAPAPAHPISNDVVHLQEVRWNHAILRSFIGFGEFLPETQLSDTEKKDLNSTLTTSSNASSGGGDPDDAEAGDDSKDTSSKIKSANTVSMFVACNGLFLDVFRISAEKRWSRTHTIALAELQPTLSQRITCKMMMESISSNNFMWLEDGGRSCTIWNLLMGSNVTHISSIENARFKGPTFRGHSKMAISPHESIVALASVDGSLTTYFANTGMAIDDRKFPGYKIEHVGFHAQDDQLFVILRSSITYELSARILDTLQLRSESPANQVPIPTIGSTILAFFYTRGYWNRGVICEAEGPKINCYISHQPPTNKFLKNSETVLTADPDDVVYESSMNSNIQYRLVTGIHRELLPEGDGVSYWVLRVEVWEENLAYKTQKVIFSFVPEPWMRVTTGEVVHPENLQSVFFLPSRNRFDVVRFAVVGMQTLQLWNLPMAENSKCTLQYIWSQPRDDIELQRGGIAYKSTNVRDYYLDTLSTTISMDTETGNTVAEIKVNDKSRKKIVSIPGPGTIGARFAILFCFRSIHLLAAAYAFSSSQSKKSTRDTPQMTFTFEDHAEAIVSFTREHINRMMSIGVYSPSKRSDSSQTTAGGGGGKNKPKKDKPKEPKKDKPQTDGGRTSSRFSRGRSDSRSGFTSASDSDSNRQALDVSGAVVVGGNIVIHDSDNKWGSDAMSKRLHRIRARTSFSTKAPPPTAKMQSNVVTLLTLLLDHAYLQETNHLFVEGLLNTANGDWIPRDNKALNPIKRVIESRDGALVEAFVDYCIRNAKKYHPAYLMPAVQCLNELSDRYPHVLADMFRKASYVPVHNHDYVASHAVIANPQYGSYLKSSLKFWDWFGPKFEKSNIINDYERPVFSLRSQLPIRTASFLSSLSVEAPVREKRLDIFPAKRDVVEEEKRKMQSAYSHKIYVSPFPKLSMYGPYRPWFKDRESTKSAFTDIAGQDFFDSPAMVATLEFKWHKFGFFFWTLRFLVVLTFFLLQVVITALQINSSTLPSDGSAPPGDEIAARYLTHVRPVFKIAIAFGLVLIAYEVRQFLETPRKYMSSPYNYMDLAAYVTPVIGCFLFLQTEVGTIDPETNMDRGPSQIWVMSFAILFLYMNILFELRVIRQLGIVVNIILNITRSITWFFLIFGLFLVSFTHALLHLLHTRRFTPCPPDGCQNSDYPDGYPRGFFGALGATYFFLAGRYDPISTSFEFGSTSFHIMMVIFFFFTAILLLNILIALMNDAFNESKDQGQLAWLKQWSEVIAEVEIFLMGHSARQNRNYFPDYIYYGASEQEAELYESKYYIANKSNLSIENRFLVDIVSVEQNATQLNQRAIMRDVQNLGKELEKLKRTQDGFTQDITQLTKLMAEFLAQTTTVTTPMTASMPSSSAGMSETASPVENDPPATGASLAGTFRTFGTPGPTPPMPPSSGGAGGLPGGVVRSSAVAGAQPRQGVMRHPAPGQKVGTTASETELPAAGSQTVHFNSPTTVPGTPAEELSQLISTGPILYDPSSAPGPSGAPGSSTRMAPVPYQVDAAEIPERATTLPTKLSQSSLKRRFQEKMAVVHTMDSALKAHHAAEENDASHPMYLRPPGRIRSKDDDVLYKTDDEDAVEMMRPLAP